MDVGYDKNCIVLEVMWCSQQGKINKKLRFWVKIIVDYCKTHIIFFIQKECFDQMNWNLIRLFLSCGWIWNRHHFGFRRARSYAKLIFTLILTIWAEIWYVGFLAESEYGTDTILKKMDARCMLGECLLNAWWKLNFIFLASILTKWAEFWHVDSLVVLEYGTDAILNFEGERSYSKLILIKPWCFWLNKLIFFVKTEYGFWILNLAIILILFYAINWNFVRFWNFVGSLSVVGF